MRCYKVLVCVETRIVSDHDFSGKNADRLTGKSEKMPLDD